MVTELLFFLDLDERYPLAVFWGDDHECPSAAAAAEVRNLCGFGVDLGFAFFCRQPNVFSTSGQNDFLGITSQSDPIIPFGNVDFAKVRVLIERDFHIS
jgi:hypothetical protein